MPPRTGPRRKRRAKQAALPERHFTVVRGLRSPEDDTSGAGRGAGYSAVSAHSELATAHRIELDAGHLVLRDAHDTIVHIIAPGEWREARQVTAANPADYSGTDLLPEVLREPLPENREPTEVTRGVDEPEPVPRAGDFIPLTQEEADRRFVPSSPEEAQRILRELHRRLAPDYQDPPDCQSDAPPAPRKD